MDGINSVGTRPPGVAAAGAPGSPQQALDESRFAAVLAQIAPFEKGAQSPQQPGVQPAGNIKQAAQSFEAFFIQQLFSVMRQSVPQGGVLDAGFAGGVYQDMLDGELAQRMAAAGGLGLAKMVSAQLLQQAGAGAGDRPAALPEDQ